MKMSSRTLSFISAILLITACNQQKGNTPNGMAGNSNDAEKSSVKNTSSITIEFTQPDCNGRNINVKNEFAKNQLTIIDFWASWCEPCRKEMPNLLRIYEEYNHKGLGIIGVSLDYERTQWIETVKRMKLPWLQLSDLRYWANKAAEKYKITAIPFTMVVDQDGRLIAAGLEGNNLEMFIKEQLDRK